ncbi:MAG: ATP-binding protein [Actinomycetota bacterium]|nr:ATP-binding protein [Actinomycetota bacterium]
MIISVASGKGGTGKTTVSVALAQSLGYCNYYDFDVEAPNSDIFLKPDINHYQKVYVKYPYFIKKEGVSFKACADFCHFNAIASINEDYVFFEELCHGCGGCILVGPEGYVKEKEAEVGEISKGFKSPGIYFHMGNLKPKSMRTSNVQADLEKMLDEEQTVIIDSPPGNSCSMVNAVKNCDYCILVTEPTPYGLSDLKISIDVLKDLNKKFGIVINRDGIGNKDLENYLKENGYKILLKIPNDINIAKTYSKGGSLLDWDSDMKEKFLRIMDEIEKEVGR